MLKFCDIFGVGKLESVRYRTAFLVWS